MKRILALIAIVAFTFALPSCKGKSDADLKTAAEAALQSNPDLTTVMVDVKDAVATISGEVKDPATQSAAESAVKSVEGIKSVENLTSPAPPPLPVAPVTISADDSLTTAVTDAIKDHPTVSASVAGGIVTLTGEISKDDLKVLMQKVQATKPKKVDSKGLTVK
ncbi:BON domain-containing protein [Niabella ginsengisoli]|uniref:BON domain-containing protein n=1 Tax=Niabella ginsengisoli TaxID=522298 RepID=A0ABS9SJK5_9BACT|nr:BON domain-containing protein [Niabella ginsengisoli]MCH5598544.1 BON domain-containing protein [Niabella ginsengisoli]